MIFCQYNYKEFHNENTDKHPTSWQIMLNDNRKHCKEMNWVKWINFYLWVYILRRCHQTDLPSFHSYWSLQVNKDRKKYIKRLQADYEQCRKDTSKIKYLFNRTTTLKDIEKRIIELKKKQGK